MYMDDINIFCQEWKRTTYSRIEFGIEKCAIGKKRRETTKRIELSNQENIGTLGENE